MPYLYQISQKGVVTITFNTDMQIPPNLKMYESATIQNNGVEKPVVSVDVLPGSESDPSKLSF